MTGWERMAFRDFCCEKKRKTALAGHPRPCETLLYWPHKCSKDIGADSWKSILPYAWITKNFYRTWQTPLPRQSARKHLQTGNELCPRAKEQGKSKWKVLNSLAAKQIKSEGKWSQFGAFKLQTGVSLDTPVQLKKKGIDYIFCVWHLLLAKYSF